MSEISRDKTLPEVAAYFGLSARSIYNWVKAGCPHDFLDTKNKTRPVFDITELTEWRKRALSIKGQAARPIPDGAVSVEEAAHRMGVAKKTVFGWVREGAPAHLLFPNRKTRQRPHFLLSELRSWHKEMLRESADREAVSLPEGATLPRKAAKRIGVHYDTLLKWLRVEGAPVYYKYPTRKGAQRRPHVIPSEFKKWFRARDIPEGAPEDVVKASEAAAKLGITIGAVMRWIERGAPSYGWRPTFVSVEELQMWRQREKLRRCDVCGVPFLANKSRWAIKRCKSCQEAHRKESQRVASLRYKRRRKQAKLLGNKNEVLQSHSPVSDSSCAPERGDYCQADQSGQ